LVYVSAIAPAKRHKVFGFGIISAFNPLSISDLAKKIHRLIRHSTRFNGIIFNWFSRAGQAKNKVGEKNFPLSATRAKLKTLTQKADMETGLRLPGNNSPAEWICPL